MVRVGRDLKDHLVPTPMPRAGTSGKIFLLFILTIKILYL